MNEHNNTSKSDDDISKLYAQASNEKPPVHIDDAILNAAKILVEDKPPVIGPFSRRWSVPVSLAAVIIMSVSLVTLIQHEAPEELTSLPESVMSQAAPNKPELLKSDTKESPSVRKRKDSASNALKNKPIALAKKRATPKRSERLTLDSPPKTIVNAEEEMAAVESLAPQEQIADMPRRGAIAEKRAADSSTAFLMEKPKHKIPHQPPKSKAASPAFTAAVPTVSCHSLSISSCLESLECILTLKGTGYQCRQARNHCEQNFSQKTGTTEQCTTKPNCKFVPGKCFCPPDVTCVCGGGPPRMCVPQ